jgi:hypothetical protein
VWSLEQIIKHSDLPLSTSTRDMTLPMLKPWSVQGFGVLRFYIRNLGRLHVWDSRLRYPKVSLIHNHSWDLTSTVVSGVLVNRRFELVEQFNGRPYWQQRLLTGYDSKMEQPEPEKVFLLEEPRETYLPGEVYHQRAEEIHASYPDDHTITLMARRENDAPGFADVFWQPDEEWGTAKPRGATLEELWKYLPPARDLLIQSLEAHL